MLNHLHMGHLHPFSIAVELPVQDISHGISHSFETPLPAPLTPETSRRGFWCAGSNIPTSGPASRSSADDARIEIGDCTKHGQYQCPMDYNYSIYI